MTRYYLKRWYLATGLAAAVASGTSVSGFGQQRAREPVPAPGANRAAKENADRLLAEGMQTFRYDTFGSEEFWGDKVKLHEAIQGAKFGGMGSGLSPKQALELGLKVDMDAVPKNVAAAMKAGKVDLNDPANTLLLLKANAVVGVTGFFNRDGKSLRAVGIQCALCHSTVDDAFSKGVGHRLDGWPNRDLNIGAIVSTAPDGEANPFVAMPISPLHIFVGAQDPNSLASLRRRPATELVRTMNLFTVSRALRYVWAYDLSATRFIEK